ncbi:LCP family protein [Cohnella terricola]|uniref:LytR family transcriptional regulator n=1 Tax=Cohnella terricola TaxID=1289167 RepID=A0A559JMM4_9BACL|nr:LCP family protein [Cohnella terricola]TVY01134.1 LytR family transcriptional regulator [Cohnella terricola]
MKRKRIVRLIVYSFVSFLALLMIAGGYLWYSVHKTMDAMYEPLPSVKWEQPRFENDAEGGLDNSPEPTERPGENETAAVIPLTVSDKDPTEPAIISEKDVERLRNPKTGNEDPFSMLLLGVDERPGDRGRSDTMILLTLQPRTGKAVALSIPRDTRVLMPNSGKYDKINHAYAFGGIPLSVEAVEHLFGVPIAYYIKTNMEGLVQIVDTMGGVDVDSLKAFEFDGQSFPIGKQHLNGVEALAYSRMRKEDPHGDFGRTQRQREILSELIDQLTDANSIVKLPKILSHLSEYVRTNLSSGNMYDLASKYRPAISGIETLNLQGNGKMINGIYYYAITPEERRRIQEEMLKCLNAT